MNPKAVHGLPIPPLSIASSTVYLFLLQAQFLLKIFVPYKSRQNSLFYLIFI
jgi:hypothetical protein